MKAIEWLGNAVRFLDQTKLPFEESYITTDRVEVVCEAIRSLRIRGAPLIGIAAAYGVCLSALDESTETFEQFLATVLFARKELSQSRPTAVNLFRALERMEDALRKATSIEEAKKLLIEKALAIHQEDAEMCRLIGEHGSNLIPDGATILTICNTGILATGGDGTAQSIITTAHRKEKKVKVFACETRPLLQGARLTTWELQQAGIDVTLITDSMAATLMKRKHVDCVITGADRIAANGDAANKIGTYSLAVLARYHNIPFYVAAPSSTIDFTITNGVMIPIEERNPAEVREVFGKRIAPENVQVWNPSFDMTPNELLSAIITESDVHYPPFLFREQNFA
ncbi:MAG: S-methyl-5-thioribose-1-phosphate isomerase [Bacteroidetes bacterium]|nr:MAG: S-methyl-5-thioribose-1-phosphate isomerase [Bacteroidota bacterium]